MVPSGPPPGAGGSQSIASSLLRTNSGSLGGVQPGSIPPQQPFSSLISPRVQFSGGANGSNMNFLGAIANASSLINHSLGNVVPASGGLFSTPQMNSQLRGAFGTSSLDMLGCTESDPLTFPSPSGSLHGQHLQNPTGNPMMADHSHSQSQQLDAVQSFQHQVSVPHNQQRQHHRGGLANVGGMGPVKFEEQTGSSDQSVPGQQIPSIRDIGQVKMEPLHLQSVKSLGPAKMEHQQTDSSLFLQQHQQQHAQQQLLQMSRSTPHAAAAAAQMTLLQQQRFLQIQQQKQQQQQQHQLFKTIPQRIQLQQQLQHGVPIRPQIKQTIYEPGMCARRLTQYMYLQQHRPEDNNIDFWRKFAVEFFASNAKKRWCVSLYGSGRQTTGVFPQDVWHCEICKRKPGRGFEATIEVLPRLLQIKYASGTLEELLYVDMPQESHTTSGQIVLDYAKAVQESVFEQLRVVRDGQLRIVFNPDLKISSWEFCARRHEELIPRRLIMHQVSQLGAVVQKHQTVSQNAPSSLSIQDLQSTCNSFVASTRQLAKALEVQLVNDLGYTKRYVRCLQISEVVNSMKDLIDYSRETGTGPMDSLIKFPKRSSSSGLNSQQLLQQDTQQNVMQNSSQIEQSSHGTGMQLGPHNAAASASTSGTPMVGLLHQNSVNLGQENQMNSLNSVFGGGNPVQIPSACSSNSIPPSQPNPSSPFPLTPTSNNIIVPSTHISRMNCVTSPPNMPTAQLQAQPSDPDSTDSHSSVQQMLQEMMMSSQLNGVSAMSDDGKSIGSVAASLNGGNCLVGNGRANSLTNNLGVGSGMGFGFGIGGISPSVATSGLRAAMTNNSMNINGRIGMNTMSHDPSVINHYQQQDMGNRLVRGLGSVNNFDNLQFDWKPSP